MKKRALHIIIVLAVVTIGSTTWNTTAMALYGTDMPFAERVTDGRFPAVVRIWFPGYVGYFSGVLISPHHVLTAAHAAPLHGGEIHDSAWHEASGGHADDVEHVRFSFAGEEEPGDHPSYTATQYWVHPEYNPDYGTLANWDLMLLVTQEPITEVDPVPVLAPSWIRHVHPGAWVRHVSFGPTEGAGAHAYKTSLLSRITAANFGTAQIFTMGEAGDGDSGSPVFQRREDDSGVMREVLVGILTNEGIRSQLMTHEIDSWIREIVYKMYDMSLMPDDCDGDGIFNQIDYCMLKYSGPIQMDDDGDGIGNACDSCPEMANGGQFDTDGDGLSNGCDDCPFPVYELAFDELAMITANEHWTRNPVVLEVHGVQSDGRWIEEEYTTHISVEPTPVESAFRHVRDDDLVIQDNSVIRAVASNSFTSSQTESSLRHVRHDDLVIQDNSDLRAFATNDNGSFGSWSDERLFEGLRTCWSLSQGEHRAEVYIEDGCGNLSDTQVIRFGVDDTPPALSIRRDRGGLLVPIGASFTVKVTVEEGLSGLNTVALWLDNPGYDEFSYSRKLGDISGPWTTGEENMKRYTVTADFTSGLHTIYAIAEDLAGNESVASFTIFCYRLVSAGGYSPHTKNRN